MVSILDITQALSSAILLFVYKILAQSKKWYKIGNFSPISAKFKNQTTQIVYNYEELFGSKLVLRETWSGCPFFRQIKNFIKCELFAGLFPNSILNVLEHWSLKKAYPPERQKKEENSIIFSTNKDTNDFSLFL